MAAGVHTARRAQHLNVVVRVTAALVQRDDVVDVRLTGQHLRAAERTHWPHVVDSEGTAYPAA